MEVETSYYQQLLEQYLKKAVDDGASDLFIIAGGKVSYKVDGAIQDLSEEKVFPDQTKELIQALYAMAGRDMRKYQTDGDDDFSFAKAGLARFRVNAFQRSFTLRYISIIFQGCLIVYNFNWYSVISRLAHIIKKAVICFFISWFALETYFMPNETPQRV